MNDPIQIAAGCAALAAVFGVMVAAPKLWWLMFGFLIWASTFSQSEGILVTKLDATPGAQRERVAYAFPLSILSESGRPICGICLVALVGQGIMTRRGWRQKRVIAATVFFMILELYYATRMVLLGGDSRAVLALVTFVLNAIFYSAVLPNKMQSAEDFRRPIYALALAAGLFAAGNIYQSLLDSRVLYFNGRFQGTTINCNHCGHLIAILLPPVCWLAFDPHLKKSVRVAFFLLVAVLALWLMRTGCRGAALATFIGVGFCLRSRLKHIFAYGGVAVALSLVWMQFRQGLVDDNSRLLSLQDTRSQTWMRSLAMWADSPIWGYAGASPVFTENSYLAAAAAFGIVGLTMIGGFALYALSDLRTVNRELRRSAQLIAPVDIVTGGILGVMACGAFEAILLGIYTPWVFTLLCYLAMLAYLKDVGRLRKPVGDAVANGTAPVVRARYVEPPSLQAPHPV